jgi:PPOX class probable F420-dependent enzyme
VTANRRAQIAMTGDEVAAFLAEQRTLICATNGRDGWPHLMPLWYVMRGQEIWSWTYAKSQKVRNLERDPRATLQVEAGESYDQLRGVMLEADTIVHPDMGVVTRLGLELAERYSGGPPPDAAVEIIRRQAAKRVALQFTARRTASWDHRKLA